MYQYLKLFRLKAALNKLNGPPIGMSDTGVAAALKLQLPLGATV
jgi:hypothetical protein